MNFRRLVVLAVTLVIGSMFVIPASANEKSKKPNILIIWGDDIGWFNISAYNRGMMSYKTPNIDKIDNDGI